MCVCVCVCESFECISNHICLFFFFEGGGGGGMVISILIEPL